MKIQIQNDEQNLCIRLPSALAYSSLTGWIGEKCVRRYTDYDIPLKALFRELRRMKRLHGSMTLVEVDSADGEHIRITL